MSNLIGEMIDLNLVVVTWTALSLPPSRGYQITTATSNDTLWGTAHVLNISEPGNHTIQVFPLSQHLPYEIASTSVVVRGEKEFTH